MTKLKDLKAHFIGDSEFREDYSLIEALVRARAAANLTQAELARRLGTTQSAVARLEGGRVSPSLASSKSCAGSFHVITQSICRGAGLVCRLSSNRRAA